MEANVPWSFIAVVVGGCLSVVGALIVLNLSAIKKCIREQVIRNDKQDDNIKDCDTGVNQLSQRMSDCKVDCDRTFVTGEAFLRETGFTRRSLEKVTSGVDRLDGKLTVVEKLPQICGDISREIVKEMKNGEHQ